MSRRRAVLAIFGVLLVAAVMGGAIRHIAQRARVSDREMHRCHARGPAYHYWYDRHVCVRYTDQAPEAKT